MVFFSLTKFIHVRWDVQNLWRQHCLVSNNFLHPNLNRTTQQQPKRLQLPVIWWLLSCKQKLLYIYLHNFGLSTEKITFKDIDQWQTSKRSHACNLTNTNLDQMWAREWEHYKREEVVHFTSFCVRLLIFNTLFFIISYSKKAKTKQQRKW